MRWNKQIVRDIRHRDGNLSGVLTAALIAACFACPATAQQILHSFQGDAALGQLGQSVDGAGDVDGDGFGDVIVGVPYDDKSGAGSGSARVYSGKDGSALHIFLGDSPGDALGISVSGAGDVNNDGVPDLIAGANGDDDNGNACGSARVYSGKDGLALYTFYGDTAKDDLGHSVSDAGDVNNDGFLDVIAGAALGANPTLPTGLARVYSGSNGATLYSFYGNTGGGSHGFSVSGAGDTNNDGFDDVVVGAHYEDNNGTDSGNVRIYSGQTGSVLHRFPGDQPNDYMGYSVSDAGDMNNDGFADIIAGANAFGLSGFARTYSGQDGSILYDFQGDSISDALGFSVGAIGDVDNDGFDDVIAGALKDDDNGQNAGSARVFSGQGGAVIYHFDGDVAGDLFGYSVGGAGDVNNDGVPDVIVGAIKNSSSAAFTGLAKVYSGSSSPFLTYGSGCTGPSGVAPTLVLSGSSAPGGNVQVSLSSATPSQPALLFVGFTQAALPAGCGCTLNLQPTALQVPIATDAAGSATFGATLPISLPAISVKLQAFVADAACGFSATNGVSLAIQ